MTNQPTTTFSHASSVITESDIADYLLATPDFFSRHAALLSSIQLTHPHSDRAISLADWQMDLQRERYQQLEMKYSNLLRVGKENVAMARKLHQWIHTLLIHTKTKHIKKEICASLQTVFDVPQVAIDVSEFARGIASTMTEPVCGAVTDIFFKNAHIYQSLEDAAEVQSLAAIPLPSMGLLILASNDQGRFTADLGVEFLTRLGDLAHAALLP